MIEIKVKGKEKASFWEQENYQEDDGQGGTIDRQRDVKKKMNKMILDYRGNCF